MNVVALRPRSSFAVAGASLAGLAGFCWPLFVNAGAGIGHGRDAPWLFAALLPLLLAVVLAELAEGGMDAKAVALLGVLAAIGAVLRPLSTGLTGFTFIFVLLIPAGRVLGAGFGFVLGALSMFASAVLTGGIGPWLPFEMLGVAWVGLGAGLLPQAGGRIEVAMLSLYGAVAGLLYGLLLNLWSWPFTLGQGTAPSITYQPGASIVDNLHRFIAYDLASSLGFDIPRAVGNAVLLLALSRPIMLVLRRAGRRAAFDVPVQFDDPDDSASGLAPRGDPPSDRLER
jgi:energy-coupling factor transport system substrate-specific component